MNQNPPFNSQQNPSDNENPTSDNEPGSGWDIPSSDNNGDSKRRRSPKKAKKSQKRKKPPKKAKQAQKQRKPLKTSPKNKQHRKLLRTSKSGRQSEKEEPSNRPDTKRKGLVAVVDHREVTFVDFSKGDVTSVTSEMFDTPEESFAAACKAVNKKIGGFNCVVWAGEFDERIINTIQAHGKVADIAKGEELLSVFKNEDVLVSSISGIAVKSDLPAPKVSVPVVPSVFAVGDEEGVWVRVGNVHTTATLVLDGKIEEIHSLAHGLNNFSVNQLTHGEDPTELLKEDAKKIGTDLNQVISAWGLEHPNVRRIFLSGPGNDPRSVLADTLCQITARSVLPPNRNYGSHSALLDRSDIPTAVNAINAPKFESPHQLITAQKRKTFRYRAATAVAAGIFLIAAAVISHRQNESLKTRHAELEDLIAQHEASIDHKGIELSAQAEIAQQTLDAVAATELDDPNWPLLMILKAGESLSTGRHATSLNLKDSKLIEGYVSDLYDMDRLAVIAYGTDAYATSGRSAFVDANERVQGNVSVSEPEILPS